MTKTEESAIIYADKAHHNYEQTVQCRGKATHKTWEDLSGIRFGRWVALYPTTRGKLGIWIWHCLCDCGAEKDVPADSLVRNYSFSCGCYHRDKQKYVGHLSGLMQTEHGDSMRGRYLRLYGTWRAMKRRCYRINSEAYRWYGAKGVCVCPEWKNNYPAFKKWAIENGYQDNLTIDRILEDGNYEPSNCQFISLADNTRKAQLRAWAIKRGESL